MKLQLGRIEVFMVHMYKRNTIKWSQEFHFYDLLFGKLIADEHKWPSSSQIGLKAAEYSINTGTVVLSNAWIQ